MNDDGLSTECLTRRAHEDFHEDEAPDGSLPADTTSGDWGDLTCSVSDFESQVRCGLRYEVVTIYRDSNHVHTFSFTMVDEAQTALVSMPPEVFA